MFKLNKFRHNHRFSRVKMLANFIQRSFSMSLVGLIFFLAHLSPVSAAGGVIYVKTDATGANNGSSWADAFTSLEPALSAASSGDQIWIAQGIYKPTSLQTPGNPRSATFLLKNGVALYGGLWGVKAN
jgi:hypothetical protein